MLSRYNQSSVSLSSWKNFEYNDQILGDLLENDSILTNTQAGRNLYTFHGAVLHRRAGVFQQQWRYDAGHLEGENVASYERFYAR